MTTSQIFWNGSCVTAAPPSTTCAAVTFNASSTQISVIIPAAYIASTGIPQISVVNPFPGGPSLVAATFTISPANNPVPTITSLSPSNTPVGALPPGGTITVNGTNFISTSSVTFNGNARATQFVSATQLTATLVASDVTTAGGINVQVSNPKPGGGVSTGATFTVGPVPAAIIHKVAFSGAQLSPALISISATGGAANGASSAPAMSADGRFVAFYSDATNLVVSGASGNIFVRDTCNGAQNCAPQTTAVDLNVNGNYPNAPAGQQIGISADGRFVVFSSLATDIVVGSDSTAQNGTPGKNSRVYVRDLCEGSDVPAGCVPHTGLASVDPTGIFVAEAFPAVSGDGRFVAFVSTAANVAAGGAFQSAIVYIRDTCAGRTANSACTPKTVEADSNGVSPQAAAPLAISADGRYVAFSASAAALSSQQASSAILLVDTCQGIGAPADCNPKTVNVSTAPDASLVAANNILPSISGDGRFIVFESSEAVSAGGSASTASQVFLRDTCLGQTAPNGCAPSTTLISDNAMAPSIDSSGRYITYVAAQSPTAGGAGNLAGSLFIYDTCFSAAASCVPGAYPAAADVDSSTVAPISAAAGVTAFTSKAPQDLLPSSGLGDIYLILLPQ